MFNKLNSSIDNYSPSVQEPNPDYIPEPILNNSFINDFQSVLGSTVQYSSDMNDRLFHGHGHTLEEIWKLRNGGKFDRLPDWVVWPHSHSDIEKIVRLAVKHNICLIPFGGGTSVTWALLCPANEKRMIVSVDTSQMNKILYLDEKNLTARIQSGIIGQDLERELGKKGIRNYFFKFYFNFKYSGYCTGHEPDSMEFSSLGGWVATRASGMKKNVYGNIEDLVVHITMVTAKGTVEKSCLGPRQSTGPDIHHFIMGSEGILGIVTEVTMKIRPLPACKKYGSIVFPDFESGVACLREVARLRSAPASIRLLDNEQFIFGQALSTDNKGMLHTLVDNMKKLYITKIKGFDVNRMCAATLLFEGTTNEVNQREKFVYDIAQKYNGIPAGEENGLKGYTLTFMIAYLRDVGLDYQVVAESFETSVPWDRVIGKRKIFILLK
jgi:alkyldihydroxyacetonephosphate synthase